MENQITPAQIAMIPIAAYIAILFVREIIIAFKPYSPLDGEFDIKSEKEELEKYKWWVFALYRQPLYEKLEGPAGWKIPAYF